MWLSACAKTALVYRSTSSARSMLCGNAADMSPDSSPLPALATRSACCHERRKAREGQATGQLQATMNYFDQKASGGYCLP